MVRNSSLDMDGSNAQDDDTLLFWPDPKGRFGEVLNKSDYRVNTNIQAFDHLGNLVHPRDWAKIFTPGTMVEAHCMPIMYVPRRPR